jgi:hypothetical protein
MPKPLIQPVFIGSPIDYGTSSPAFHIFDQIFGITQRQHLAGFQKLPSLIHGLPPPLFIRSV